MSVFFFFFFFFGTVFCLGRQVPVILSAVVCYGLSSVSELGHRWGMVNASASHSILRSRIFSPFPHPYIFPSCPVYSFQILYPFSFPWSPHMVMRR
ncbi:hypothetical protein FN846DRAFT_981019 [Sphaerosporella brunnea]|uniref:Secreted protein n=1 Tax=Sphaerosporella brunnea TaxID=1250544 RepID=A0A5J5ED58_9PEZI|nr:hypothetical protein FN846DRAFT_981010 [Sphaerosporella brunnea]KAA8892989.1 hypothetical protein FN846DRAFT_981019 [Sphaerosporella brunnea]